MPLTRWTALALALVALPLGGQTVARTSQPGWIGFFAGFEQTSDDAAPVAVVVAIAEGSPAARVGLAEGDVLLAVDGRPLTAEGLKALSAGLRAGERVELTLLRDGTRRTLTVRADVRPPATTMLPDPVALRLGSARRLLLRADSVERAAPAAPPARRAPVRAPEAPVAPELPEAGWTTPFNAHVFRDARTDSLSAALRRVDRQLVAARSAESARQRELAARVGTQGGRIDARDPELLRLRARREALAAERTLLRATLERIVAERAESPSALGPGMEAWTMEVAPPAEPTATGQPAATPAPSVVVRPMTPYIAGRDRVAGARVTPLNPGLAEYFGTSRGVLVVEVATGTPADEAGLRPGDVLLRVGGADVDGLDALRRAVAAAPADQPVPVILLRKGTRVQLALPR